jgi:hypothetical protein
MSEIALQVELKRKHQSILMTDPLDYLKQEKMLLKFLSIRQQAAIGYEGTFDEDQKKETGKIVEYCNENIKNILDLF